MVHYILNLTHTLACPQLDIRREKKLAGTLFFFLNLTHSLYSKNVTVLPSLPHIHCLLMAVTHVVFAYALLSHLNHLRSLSFPLTCAMLVQPLKLKFFKQRKGMRMK